MYNLKYAIIQRKTCNQEHKTMNFYERKKQRRQETWANTETKDYKTFICEKEKKSFLNLKNEKQTLIA